MCDITHSYVWRNSFNIAMEGITSRIRMSHVTHMCMKELRHTYEWVMSHTCVWRSYVTHTNESCHTHNTCNLIHYRGHVSGMTHVSLSSVWHDACVTVMCVTWPMCHTLTCVWATWFNIAVMCVINSDVTCVTWLIRMCDVTDSYTCVTWRIHAHVRQDPFMHVCDMTHSCTCATWHIHARVRHDSFMHVCDMTLDSTSLS